MLKRLFTFGQSFLCKNELYFKELTQVRCAKEGVCVYVDHVTAIPSVPPIPTNATVARSANVTITPVITLRISFVEVLFCFLILYSKLIRKLIHSLSTCELVSVNLCFKPQIIVIFVLCRTRKRRM